MEYRDRAVAAVRSAERKLREELRPIIMEAIEAEAYADVASIARIAGALSHLLRHVASDTYAVETDVLPSLDELFETARLSSARTTPEGNATTIQKLLADRASSRREQYPRFLRDGERLVKIAWSKKDRAPYEHRAPHAVVHALISAVEKKKGEGKVFQAADVMPLKSAQNEEYPSYQSYLALNWLREVGVISKKGRQGYVLKPRAATAEKLGQLWTGLPVAESSE